MWTAPGEQQVVVPRCNVRPRRSGLKRWADLCHLGSVSRGPTDRHELLDAHLGKQAGERIRVVGSERLCRCPVRCLKENARTAHVPVPIEQWPGDGNLELAEVLDVGWAGGLPQFKAVRLVFAVNTPKHARTLVGGVSSEGMKAELRGVKIGYETVGVGRSVLWGHGLTSSRADEAVPPVMIDWPRVAEHCALTRYDARGHGASDYTAEPEGYAWSELAKDQVALIEHLDLGSVVLGGASMGAATALHTAVLAPDRVDALLLVIPPTAWETRAGQTGMYQQMAEIIERRGVELLISAGAAAPPPDPFVGRPAFTERGAARLRQADPVRLAGVFRGASLATMPPKEAVAAIDVPTLVLAWSGDTGHPVSTAELLVELMPKAELSVASTWDELQTWTDRATAFIARH